MTALWIRYRFGAVVLEQVVLNLPIGAGEGIGDNRLGVELGLWLGGTLAAVVAVAVVLRRRSTASAPVKRAARTGGLRGGVALLVIACLMSFASLAWTTGVPQYLGSLSDGRSIGPYYVQPAVERAVDHPKNLVTVYLESMENTFSRRDVFGENLLGNLDRATAGWTDYEGLNQDPAGGWTMAGLVATQCGIPLKSDLLQAGMDPNLEGQQISEYLPRATCLGDVLAAQGYRNVFLGGADDGFAGKSTFLSEHGYSTIKGLGDWRQAGVPDAEVGEWGLSDARLFDFAEEEIDRLHAAGQPFDLTLLTVDTHEPASVYPSCAGTAGLAMTRAIGCSTAALGGFLDHLRTSGFLDDTVVVVMGDHLKPTGFGNTYAGELNDAAQRTIVLRISSPDPVVLHRTNCYQFSVLPTILDLVGLHPRDGRAGIGVSLTAEYDLSGTLVPLPAADYRALLSAPSRDLYRRLWGS